MTRGIVLRKDFENHANITLSVQPWAPSLYQTLQNERANFYSQTAAEFSHGGAIQEAADDLSGAKLLLDANIALGLPRLVEANDYIRYLLYGGQQNAQTVFYGGSDPNNPYNPSTIQHLYATASPQPPELDITAITDERIDALAGVLTNWFSHISQSHVVESQRVVDRTLNNLLDLLPVAFLSAGDRHFQPQAVGTSSAPLTVRLTNPGVLSLSINSISVGRWRANPRRRTDSQGAADSHWDTDS